MSMSNRLFESLYLDNSTAVTANHSTEFAMGMAGKYTTATPSLADGKWSFLRVTSDGKLMVDTEFTGDITVGDVKVYSTDNTAANCKYGKCDTNGNVYSIVSATSAANGYSNPIYVNNVSGTSPLPANYITPFDGAATYLSTVSITCSGFPFTVDDANCVVSYIQHKPTGGVWQNPLVNGASGVSIIALANVVTVSGAGAPFAAGDTYRLGINYQDKAYTLVTNSMRTEEINPINSRFEEISLVDTTNVAASQQYYPSSDGMLMDGYKHMSLTGKYIEGDAVTSTITVWVTNDEDATASNRDWIQVYGYDAKNNTFVNQIQQVNAGTLTFAWDFDNINYKYVRIGLLPGDATNTAIIKCRRTSI